MATTRRRRGPQPATTTHLVWPSSADINEDLRKTFIDDIEKAARGGDVVLVHHRAGNRRGRMELTGLLRQWGLSPEVAAVLGWASASPEVAKAKTIEVTPPPDPSPEPLVYFDEDVA